MDASFLAVPSEQTKVKRNQMNHKQSGYAVAPHPKYREPDDKPGAREGGKMNEHEKGSGVVSTASDKFPNCDREQQYGREKPERAREDRDVDIVESLVYPPTPCSVDQYLFTFAPKIGLRGRLPIFHQRSFAVVLRKARP